MSKLKVNGSVVITEGGKFIANGDSRINVNGSFLNSGKVKLGEHVALKINYSLINHGHFELDNPKTKATLASLLDAAHNESSSVLKQMIFEAQKYSVTNNTELESKLKRIAKYVKKHPELLTSSVQALLAFLQLKAQ